MSRVELAWNLMGDLMRELEDVKTVYELVKAKELAQKINNLLLAEHLKK